MDSVRRSIIGGDDGNGGGRRIRIVERLEIHGEPVDFRTLCERVVEPSTRYVVLDLDRTFHFGRNLGELLGWELAAYRSYGPELLGLREKTQGPGRFLFVWDRPLATAGYLVRGAMLWAYPGLYYFGGVKLGRRFDLLRRMVYRSLGTEPVEAVQQIPRIALMQQLSELPVETLRDLARRVWRRHVADQVITREDLAWLRQRCPNITIIISSASPQPVLDVAAEELEVDAIMYTAVEEHEGFLSAPFALHSPFFLHTRLRRIAAPSQVMVNAGPRKMARLLERYPDFCAPDVETVGITDTSDGEDHSWAGYFKKLIDINSPTPFAPFVAASSPLREIHSAQVLTQAELAKRQGTWTAVGSVRPRIVREAIRRLLLQSELSQALDSVLVSLEELAAAYAKEALMLAPSRDIIEGRIAAVLSQIEDAVKEYNEASGQARRRALHRLRDLVRENRSLRRELVRLERPLARIMFTANRLLELSRQVLDTPLRRDALDRLVRSVSRGERDKAQQAPA